MKASNRFFAAFLIFAHLLVFHTEKIAWAQGAATSASAMASTQTLLAATLPEAFQVDQFTGRAATSIPIVVPPGRKSMQPSIAFGYTSGQRNGWLGVGWDLDLGMIQRDTKKGVPAYSASDPFVLRFQGIYSPLVQIASGEYRLENESAFLKIEYDGASWLLRDKSGTKFYFGQGAGARLSTSRGTFQWRLDRVEDMSGNYMEITYQKDGLALYPDECRYAGHTVSGLLPTNTVKFILESRPDAVSTFAPGEDVTVLKRLKEIQVTASGEMVRRFEFQYHQSEETGRSLLDSVTQFGASGAPLPPMKFAYQEDKEVSYTIRKNENPLGNSRWMFRTGGGDRFHNNESMLLPSGQYVGISGKGGGNGAMIPFGEASDALSGSDPGGVTWSQNGQGAFHVSGGRDTQFHAFTFFFLAAPAVIQFPPFTGNNMATAVFINGNEQIWFGNPSSQAVNLHAGYNLVEFTGYNQNNGYAVDFAFDMSSPAYSAINFMNSFQFIQPQFIGDFNGDGESDFAIYDQQVGEVAVSFSKSFAFIPEDSWIKGFGNLSTTPFVGDFNRDGNTDWGVFDNGTWRIAYSNGSSQFMAPVTWRTGFGVTGDRPFTGDFNGDSFTDVGVFKPGSGVWQVALSDGSQFQAAATWISGFGTNQTPFTGDFNGDGLTDILSVNETAGTWRVALGNGQAFIDRGIWLDGFGAGKAPIVFDCNSDGVTDVGYFDASTGTVQSKLSNGFSAFAMICDFNFQFSRFDSNYSFQPGDFTGDGIMDPAIFNRFTGQGEVAMSSGKLTDLLTLVDNGGGGKTKLAYRTCASYVNVSAGEVHDMPFVLPVIDTVTQLDGLGNAYTTTYTYRGGKFDFTENEFRGFHEVNVTDALLNTSRQMYAQDNVFKGRLLSSTLTDRLGNVWTVSETEWDAVEPHPGSRFVFAQSEKNTVYDGNTTSRTSRTEFSYDAYGNITETRELGDIARTGDERTTRTGYEYRTADWLVSLVQTSEVFEAGGARVSKKSFEYDGAGQLKFEKAWLHDPRDADDRELVSEFGYDDFGNITSVKDPRGNLSQTVYDTETQTYPVKTINALGREETFAYDLRFGVIKERRDLNGNVYRAEFDSFGRAAKTWNPQDPLDDPTTSISYSYTYLDSDGDGIGEILPSVTQRVRDDSPGDGVLTTQTFTDGLGRTVQVRSESEDPAVQVVSGGVTFDERGLPRRQYVPYFESASPNFVPPGDRTPLTDLKSIEFSYDAPGRRTRVNFPDGTLISTQYDDGKERLVDARGNPTERQFDGLGRIASVTEYLNGQDHTTNYVYDALDKLLRVSDCAGNVTQIEYDSAGRKISLNDPDSGLTEYRYDDAGNLLAETDSLGVTTQFTYDALSRPLTKTYSGTVPQGGAAGITNYTYDGAEDPGTLPTSRNVVGKLSQLVDSQTTTYFDYDNQGRLKEASRFILELGTVELGVAHTYDRLGRDRDVTYPDGQIVRYTYNAAGGIETLSLCHPRESGDPQPGGDPSCSALAGNFDYNAAGQLTRIDYTNGVSTAYFYSAETLRLEHLITQENLLPNDLINPLNYSPTVQTRQALHYQFDNNGNITTLTDQIHTATQNFAYDSLNRLTRAASASYGGQNFTYDPLGNLINKAGVKMNYGENANGPHAVTSAKLPGGDVMPMDYDAAGNMTKRGDAELFYDQDHRLRKVIQPDNELRTVSYDLKPGWNLVSFPVLPVDQKPFADGYVPVGASSLRAPEGGEAISDVLSRAGLTFGEEITQISRFDSETGAWVHFVNDPDYNQFTKFETGRSYEVYCDAPVSFTLTGLSPQSEVTQPLYPGKNFVGFTITEEVPASEIGNHYTLDEAVEDILRFDSASGTYQSLNAGEFSSFKPGEGYVLNISLATGYATPSLAPLATLTLPSFSRTSEFTYDSSGSRVMKKLSAVSAQPSASGSTSFFLGEGYELNVEHSRETKSIFAGDLRLFTVEVDLNDGSVHINFHHPDHLGSLNVTTNENGDRTFLAEYTPFGEVSRVEGKPPSNFGFTDQEHDSSGLIYMNARYYDPLSGRFTSPDDIVQDPFDPQFLNRYTYVRNNPIQFVDPSGLVTQNEVFGQSRLIAGTAAAAGIPGANIIVAAINIYFIIRDIIGLFRNLFSEDSDNGYYGIVATDVIQSQYLSPFQSLQDGTQTVRGPPDSGISFTQEELLQRIVDRLAYDPVFSGSLADLTGGPGIEGPGTGATPVMVVSPAGSVATIVSSAIPNDAGLSFRNTTIKKKSPEGIRLRNLKRLRQKAKSQLRFRPKPALASRNPTPDIDLLFKPRDRKSRVIKGIVDLFLRLAKGDDLQDISYFGDNIPIMRQG